MIYLVEQIRSLILFCFVFSRHGKYCTVLHSIDSSYAAIHPDLNMENCTVLHSIDSSYAAIYPDLNMKILYSTTQYR